MLAFGPAFPMKALLVGILIGLSGANSYSSEHSIPVGWRLRQAERNIILLPESHSPTRIETDAERMARTQRLFAEVSLVLREGHGFSPEQVGRRCPDDLTTVPSSLAERVPEFAKWKTQLGAMGEALAKLLPAHGDYHLAMGGIGNLTDLGLAGIGVGAEVLQAQLSEPAPSSVILAGELASGRKLGIKLLETFEANLRAWCQVPLASRSAYLNMSFALASQRARITTNGEPMSWEAWREVGLQIDSRVMTQAIACALSETPCPLRDEAPTTVEGLMLGMDRHRALVLLERRNADMAEAIERESSSDSVLVIVGASHLPDFVHPTLRVTGLLERMRRLGYSVTPIW